MHAQIPKSCNCSLLTVASLIIVLLSLAWLSPPAHAFKANEEGHEGITRQALGDISRTVDSETLRFTQRAINQIATANNRVDLSQSNAALHFDDEALDTGSSMLVALKEQVITSLLGDSADGRAASKPLGERCTPFKIFLPIQARSRRDLVSRISAKRCLGNCQ